MIEVVGMLGFVRLRAAIEAIYDLGVPLVEEDFLEFEPDMLAALEASEGVDIKEEYFYIKPSALGKVVAANELTVASGTDKYYLLNAVGYIEDQAKQSDLPLSSFKEKLLYAKKHLPTVDRKKQEQDAIVVPLFENEGDDGSP